MYLKPTVDVKAFLNKVSFCEGDVFFSTSEGDFINLKSELSRYIFVCLINKPDLITHGRIICKKSQDIRLLEEFTQDIKETIKKTN